MLVNINGSIIDTEKIYKISDITHDNDGYLSFYFTINFIDRKHETYPVDMNLYTFEWIGIDSFAKLCRIVNGTRTNEVFAHVNLEQFHNLKEYIEAKAKIIEVRNQIINYWNKSRSPIPEINF